MLYPSFEAAGKLLESYEQVPVFASFLADFESPVGIFETLKGKPGSCFLLESVEDSENWGRYSFIGINPKVKITIGGGKTILSTKDGLN